MTVKEAVEIIEAAIMELDVMSDHDEDSDVEQVIAGLARVQEFIEDALNDDDGDD